MRALLRGGLLAVLALSPLPFGSVQPAWVLVIELWAACLGAGALWIVLRDPESLPRQSRLLLVPAGALLAMGLLQLAPAPTSWTWLRSPAAAERIGISSAVPEAIPGRSSWTLSPPDTVDALARLVAYILVGIAAVVTLRDQRHVRQAAMVIAGSGAFQALYGSAEYLSGRQHIFGYAKRFYLEEATGTFINRNHFAGYLAMALPFALAVAMARVERSDHTGDWRKRVLLWLGSGRSSALFAGLAALCMWTGVILSYSRAGLAAGLVASVTLLLLMKAGRTRTLLLAGALALPVVALLWVEIRTPGERFTALGTELSSPSGRLAVWRTTLDLIGRHPLLGYGLGTFESAYEPHQPSAGGGRYDHAHNDWLEALAEGGLPALLSVLALLWLTLRPVFERTGDAAPGGSALRAAAAAGVCAIAVHSLTDFCLRIPAIAILAAVLVGILARRRTPRERGTETLPFQKRDRNRISRAAASLGSA